MRSFLHDGKRLVISAPYHENNVARSHAKNDAVEHGAHADMRLKNGNEKYDLNMPQCASPTSSTCSIAGSVN